ncbi:MAG: hypothetical protein VX278_06600 [Myxococcota bacterium]|nr:hypothetical protein [Myxococcota bacterium]
MAIEKLFQVLVVGGVSLGVQACASKQAKNSDAPTQQEDAVPKPTSTQEEAEDVAAPPRGESPDRGLFTGTNSKGEQCEDVCYTQSSGENICSEMCCWLTAVECCPDYRPPVEEEETESPKEGE